MSTYITKRARELGLTKIDAKKPLAIVVTKNDIVNAKQKDSKCCAFARAAKRQFKAKNAYFFLGTAWIEHDDKLIRYKLPPSVQKEIVAFDRSKSMAEGKYQLTPPSKTSTLKHKRAVNTENRTVRKNTGKAPRVQHRTALVRNTLEPGA